MLEITAVQEQINDEDMVTPMNKKPLISEEAAQ
jgi:hypothetical protein